MPSILNTKARRVLRYLNKYGFNNIKLTIYIMDKNSSLEEVVALEQYFIDTLKPNLNVDLIAIGYVLAYGPMSEEMKQKLRKERGIPLYIYYSTNLNLLFLFESKTDIINMIKIHHKTLNSCLLEGTLYLDHFLISLDLITESSNTNILSLEEIIELVNNKKKIS
jgi:hypothetical protein